MGYTISQYREDARSLLRDGLSIFTPTSQLDRWINQARREAARRTSCIRVLVNGKSQYGASAQPGFFVPGGAIPGNLPDSLPGSGSVNLCQTIPQQEAYPYSFFNTFMRKQYAGSDEITDIVDLSVAWGSSVYRPALIWLPFEEFQARLRSYNVLNSAFPLYWATTGDGQNGVVYLYPPPVQALEMQADAIALPAPLHSDDDYEILPENFAIAIKHGAAALSYVNTRPAQAQIHQALFLDALGVGRVASDYGKVTNYYYD